MHKLLFKTVNTTLMYITLLNKQPIGTCAQLASWGVRSGLFRKFFTGECRFFESAFSERGDFHW